MIWPPEGNKSQLLRWNKKDFEGFLYMMCSEIGSVRLSTAAVRGL